MRAARGCAPADGSFPPSSQGATSAAPGDEGVTFSATERKLMGERLDAIETRILTVAGPSASPEQRAHVHEVIDEPGMCQALPGSEPNWGSSIPAIATPMTRCSASASTAVDRCHRREAARRVDREAFLASGGLEQFISRFAGFGRVADDG